MKELSVKDKIHLIKKQSDIGKMCIENGYAIIKLPSGKYYKIRELG